MESKKFEVRKLLNDRKFWVASFLIAWATALQRQESFKQKFGTATPDPIPIVPREEELNDNQDSTTVIYEDS